MKKTNKKTVDDVLATAQKIISKKDATIRLLKTETLTARKERQVVFKMPVGIDVANFPDIQRVKIEDLPEVLAVEVKNQPKQQDVRILNLKDIEFPKQKDVEFPEVQKVQVTNPAEYEKSSSWAPAVITASVKSLAELWTKLWTRGIEIKISAEERMKPLFVTIVDIHGRPVGVPSPSSMVIPMFPGGGNSKASAPPSSIGSGRKVVTTAGTAVKLTTTATPCTKIFITAPGANGGSIYVGGSTVSAVNGSEQGIYLGPTGSATIDIDDVSKVWIDSTANSEGVTFTYVAR